MFSLYVCSKPVNFSFLLWIVLVFSFLGCRTNNGNSKEIYQVQVVKNEGNDVVSIPSNVTTTANTAKNKRLLKAIKLNDTNAVDWLTDYGKTHLQRHVSIATDFGKIEIELFNQTPVHRANFLNLIETGFLNETCFYRVAKDFVIQAGNSDKLSMAKIKRKIGKFTLPAEFHPKLKHHYGAVAMARSWENNPNKRSSPFEFYIVTAKNGASHLNGEHTVIGRVTKGLDVAMKINDLEVDGSEWPKKDVYIYTEIMD